jgi:hypothetical protein
MMLILLQPAINVESKEAKRAVLSQATVLLGKKFLA